MDVEELIKIIVNSSYTVARALCPGYLESVYQNALCHELRKKGIAYEKEAPLSVCYDGEIVGQYRVDILVEGKVIVELKAATDLNEMHQIQLVNYLTTTGIDDGLLINFGTKPIEIKRKFRILQKRHK